eukprot:4507678-Pyramimonas_sp.AAC.1
MCLVNCVESMITVALFVMMHVDVGVATGSLAVTRAACSYRIVALVATSCCDNDIEKHAFDILSSSCSG